MAKRINKIKKKLVKQGILKGKSYKQAMIDAGYQNTTARKSTLNTVVKVCQKEIMQELRAKDVTVDLLIKRMNRTRELAEAKGDYSTVTRIDELMGKYIKMFTEVIDSKQFISVSQQEQQNRLLRELYQADKN